VRLGLLRDDGRYGEVDYSKKEIAIRVFGKDNSVLPESMLFHTFAHEVVHAILNEIAEVELSENEGFVDRFGNALAQVLSTMKGTQK
jgi:hypothetical protein